MIDSENEMFEEPEDHPRSEVIPSKNILMILSTLAILASISGFFILLSIIVVSIANATILYPYGFVLGFLLLSGGITLLLSLIFLQQESKKTIGAILSEKNENKPIL